MSLQLSEYEGTCLYKVRAHHDLDSSWNQIFIQRCWVMEIQGRADFHPLSLFSDPFWLIIDFDIETSILGSLPIPSLLTDLYFAHLHVNSQILQEGLNHPQPPRLKFISQWIGVLKCLTLKCLQTVSTEGMSAEDSLRAVLLVGKTLSGVLVTSELRIQLQHELLSPGTWTSHWGCRRTEGTWALVRVLRPSRLSVMWKRNGFII